MADVTVSSEKLKNVLKAVDELIDAAEVEDELDSVSKQRLNELLANPSLARPESELIDYLRRRGVRVDD